MNETVPSDDRKTGTAQPIFPCTARKAKFETLDYVFYSPSGPVVFPSSLRPGRVGRKTAASAPHSFTLTPAVLVIGSGGFELARSHRVAYRLRPERSSGSRLQSNRFVLQSRADIVRQPSVRGRSDFCPYTRKSRHRGTWVGCRYGVQQGLR